MWRCRLAGALLGGSCVPGLPWIPPLQLGIWHSANLLGTSSQAHLFVMSLKFKSHSFAALTHTVILIRQRLDSRVRTRPHVSVLVENGFFLQFGLYVPSKRIRWKRSSKTLLFKNALPDLPAPKLCKWIWKVWKKALKTLKIGTSILEISKICVK